MANEIIGFSKYLVMADEDTWGVGGAGDVGFANPYYYIPVTDYNVRFKPENRQANPYIGIYQHAHARNFRGMPSGNMVLPLYGYHAAGMSPSIMQYLIDWAFGNYEVTDLPSKLAQWAEGPNVANKQHNGLRVNQATIAGSADNGTIALTLELMGQSESGNSVLSSLQTIPDNKNKIVECEYSDCTFQIAGVSIELDSFQLQVQNALVAKYLNSYTPSLLVKTKRLVTYTFTPIKNSDTYDAMARATSMQEFTGQITFKGLHNGTGSTGSWTTGQIDLNRLSFINADTQGGKDDISMQPVQCVALKPDTSSNDLALTWGESA